MLNLKDDKERIDLFLDKLISLYYVEQRKNQPVETCLGPAMKAGLELLKDSGGKVISFSSHISQSGAGSLKSRDDFKVYNKDQERELFEHTRVHNFYSKLGESGLKHNVAFDLYLASLTASESLDLASLAKAS
jgi:hypothetical protein